MAEQDLLHDEGVPRLGPSSSVSHETTNEMLADLAAIWYAADRYGNTGRRSGLPVEAQSRLEAIAEDLAQLAAPLRLLWRGGRSDDIPENAQDLWPLDELKPSPEEE
jgi:hypothetical protein